MQIEIIYPATFGMVFLDFVFLKDINGERSNQFVEKDDVSLHNFFL